MIKIPVVLYKILVIVILILFIGASLVSALDIYSKNEIVEKEIKSLNLKDGLVGYWSFDLINGNIIPDESGNGNHGQNYGAIEKDGISGLALDFDEDEDIVQFIPSSFDDFISDEFTIGCWLYWSGNSSPDGGPYIFDATQVYPPRGFLLQLCDNNGSISLRYGTGSNWMKIHGTEPISINTWTYIAIVFNYRTYTLRTFINGEEDNSVTVTSPYTQTELSATIGNNRWAPGDKNWRPFFGVIDEIRIYNKALSADELQKLWRNPANLKTSILIGKITNLNTDVGNLMTIEAERLRVIQIRPFQILMLSSGEKIKISEIYIGIVTPNIIFGFFKAKN